MPTGSLDSTASSKENNTTNERPSQVTSTLDVFHRHQTQQLNGAQNEDCTADLFSVADSVSVDVALRSPYRQADTPSELHSVHLEQPDQASANLFNPPIDCDLESSIGYGGIVINDQQLRICTNGNRQPDGADSDSIVSQSNEQRDNTSANSSVNLGPLSNPLYKRTTLIPPAGPAQTTIATDHCMSRIVLDTTLRSQDPATDFSDANHGHGYLNSMSSANGLLRWTQSAFSRQHDCCQWPVSAISSHLQLPVVRGMLISRRSNKLPNSAQMPSLPYDLHSERWRQSNEFSNFSSTGNLQTGLREGEDQISDNIQNAVCIGYPLEQSSSYDGCTGYGIPPMEAQANSHQDLRSGRFSRKRRRWSREGRDILQQWLITHVSRPYPTAEELQVLSIETGLKTAQIGNWFVNARSRLWKPLVLKFFKQLQPALAAQAEVHENMAMASRIRNVDSSKAWNIMMALSSLPEASEALTKEIETALREQLKPQTASFLSDP